MEHRSKEPIANGQILKLVSLQREAGPNHPIVKRLVPGFSNSFLDATERESTMSLDYLSRWFVCQPSKALDEKVL